MKKLKKSPLKAKPKRKGKAAKDKKPSGKLLDNAQELFYYGAPPAIKQLFKSNSGYDKDTHPQDFLTQLRKGHSTHAVAASWGISVHTLNNWVDTYPEMAEARAVGATAFEAYYREALRLAAFGQLKSLKENCLFKILDNQVGYGQDGGGHDFADVQGAEVVFVDSDGKELL